MRELVKKKSAADEVSNNTGDEGKMDAGKANEAAVANESQPKAGVGVVPAPVVDKNTGPGAASAAKAKDEIGVLPDT